MNDLLACCGFLCGSGCDGGYPISAWKYLVHHGVVTEEVRAFHFLSIFFSLAYEIILENCSGYLFFLGMLFLLTCSSNTGWLDFVFYFAHYYLLLID